MFGTMNPTDLRDYAGTQTLNKAFADRWVIWEKRSPANRPGRGHAERRYPSLKAVYVRRSPGSPSRSTPRSRHRHRVRVETPLSLRSILDRLPTGLVIHADATDPLRRAWEEFVLPQVDLYDRDHYETVWNAVVRRGPAEPPFTRK
jgi:hypothetical protein